MEKYDVIIVGAGPAGSTAAFYIDNLKVLLLDRCDFPRHKACGGGLMSSKDWHLEFENYNQIKDKLNACSCNSIKMYWDCKFVAGRKYRHLFDQVSRYEFDNLLFEKALEKENVSFLKFDLKKIKKVKIDGVGGFLVSDGEKEIFSRYLVGADGFGSKVSQFLGNRKLRSHQFGKCMEYDIVCDKKTEDIHVVPGYQKEIGYAWLFPTPDGYQAGIGIVRNPRKMLKNYLDDFLSWSIKNELVPKNYTIRKTSGGALPLKVARRYCTEKVLLCGDAMGLVKILTGEGIYYAMKSGKIAGQTISRGSNIRNNYKKGIKPLIRDVTLTPYIPPKLFTLSFWAGFFYLGRIFDRLAKKSVAWNFFLKIFMDKATHRKSNTKNSFYYKEKVEAID